MKILIDGQTLSTPEIHRGIGEVFLQVLTNLVKQERENEFFLAVYGDYKKEAIGEICDKITLLDLGKHLNVSKPSSEEYTRTIIRHISEKNIDCFWIPNPVMPNVNFIKTSLECRVIVTFYDLIPYIFKRHYLNAWQNDVKNEYLERLRNLKTFADFILPISDSTKNDLIRQLKISPAKMKTLYPGLKRFADENLGIPQYCPHEKYILYVGGFDPRKNMERSVRAFKQLVDTYHHNELKYIIVCGCDQETKENFLNFVQAQGLSGKVELTGHVSDFELIALYRNAEVLFFPSLYEGFGLPVAEAMAVGIPVAVSNRSSLPELVDNAGLLFDPENIDEMAEKLHRILTEPDLRKSLISRGLQVSQKFSWIALAGQYLEIIESQPPVEVLESGKNGNVIQNKPLKIAFFSPINPQVSGISQYSEELLPELQKYADIDLFLDKGIEPENSEIAGKFRYFCYTEFDDRVKTEHYDAILYQIGNNTLHQYIYRTSLRYPGIIVLHDYVIHPFIRRVTLDQGKILTYLSEILHIEPPHKKKNLIRQILKKGFYSVDVFEYPLNDRIIKASKKVIVHSQYVRKLLKGYPNVFVIPQGHFSDDCSEGILFENKKLLHLDCNDLIISVFGFINRNKRIDVVIRVFNRLQEEFANIRLLLIGAINMDSEGVIKVNVDTINVIGYVSDDLYYKYLSVSDIVINLRSPTMGETSRTLLDAMGFGKPVIVSNIGSYRETPDSCCWKVDIDENEEELLYQYLRELIINPKLREVMGNNGREFVRKNNDWKKIALKYIDILGSK
jgi:glycosyltransferase involved in cell wall biosynthesis